MLLHEVLGCLTRCAVFLAHLGQRLVQRINRKIDLGEELGNLRILLLERRGYANGQLEGSERVGWGLGLSASVRVFQASASKGGSSSWISLKRPSKGVGDQWSKQHRLAAADRRADLGVQRRPEPLRKFT